MSRPHIHALAAGYTYEVDEMNESRWNQLLLGFADSSINQTWAYAAVVAGRRNMCHLVLKLNGAVAAIAEVRLKRLPVLGLGIAYVGWGPMWRRAGAEANLEDFRQAVRALRNEFSCRRGLTLRVFPLAFDGDPYGLSTILAEEGFSATGKEAEDRTLLIDLSLPLDVLHAAVARKWKQKLRQAEEHELEVIEGTGEELVDGFQAIYNEMVSRKLFDAPKGIGYFRQLQAQLPPEHKMKIMLCKSPEGICAGLVWSAMGEHAIDLYAATSNLGTQTCGSYLLRWRLLEKLQQLGISIYNLNGINPEKNPGTYRFKRDLAGKLGRDVYYLGKFDADAGWLGHALIQVAEVLRKRPAQLRQKWAEFFSNRLHARSQQA
jgi:hypothetical protein